MGTVETKIFERLHTTAVTERGAHAMSAAESKIFERLKARLRKHGYTVVPSGRISYLAERGGMEWPLGVLEDVEEFIGRSRKRSP